MQGPQPAQLPKGDVEPHRGRQVDDDAAGPASDVQNRFLSPNEVEDDLVTFSLPVTLQPDRAVESAIVVVCRRDRIPELPHSHERLQIGPAELQQPRVRFAGAPGHVPEGDFVNLPSIRMDPDQDLFERVEIPGLQQNPLQDVPAVEAETAGQILDGQRKGPGIRHVQDAAQQPAESPDVGFSRRDIARGDHDIAIVAMPPELFQDDRPMREIGVHRDDVRRTARRKTGQQCSAITPLDLLNDPGAAGRRGIGRPIGRSSVGDDDLGIDTETGDHLFERGQKEFEVLLLVHRRDDDRQVRSRTRW